MYEKCVYASMYSSTKRRSQIGRGFDLADDFIVEKKVDESISSIRNRNRNRHRHHFIRAF